MTQRNPSGPDDPQLDAARSSVTGRTAVPPRGSVAKAALALHPERAGLAHSMRLLMRRYAAEVRAFLRTRTSSRYSMEEVYSSFSEDVWKGLPQLRSDGHVRSWIYVIARNALSRHVRLKRRWRTRHTFSGVDSAQAELRQSYASREGNLAQLAPLLSDLNEADRLLLERRLVQSMAWRDIALESARAAGDMSESFVTRESARLRKRFQLLLEALRKQADAAK